MLVNSFFLRMCNQQQHVQRISCATLTDLTLSAINRGGVNGAAKGGGVEPNDDMKANNLPFPMCDIESNKAEDL